MSGLKAPGTPWQQGRGPQGIGSQPRAQMVQGISPRLAQAAALSGGDAVETAKDIGEKLEVMAQRMFEEDTIADLQQKKADFQDKLETIVRDPEAGVLTMKGGDAKGITKSFDEQTETLTEQFLDGLSGRYLDTVKNTLHGVRSNYKRVVAQHELTQRDAMHEAARKRQEGAMMSTVAVRASTDNEAQLTDVINTEIRLTLHNFKGGPEQKAAEIQRLNHAAWGKALKARIGTRPEEALDLMARIKAGDDAFWKAENFDSDLLVSMHGEARDAYVSTMGQRYKDQVGQYGLESATKAIQADKWLTEAEKGGLIREAKQIKRAQISDMETAKRLANDKRREGVTSHWVLTGQQLTDKDFYDRGFRGKDLEAVKTAQATFFRKDPKKTDVATLLMLTTMAENGWTDPDTGKHRAFKMEDLARPEFTKALENITKEDIFGKLIPAIKKSEERGPGPQKIRSEALGIFKDRAKSIYGKDADKLWKAEDQWGVNYDDLTKKLGREPSAQELSEMGNNMMGEIVTGSGFFGGNKTARRWEARYALRTEGESSVPDDARDAIVKQYVDAGLEEPDEETIFQRYVDPKNKEWLEEVLRKEKSGVTHAADVPGGSHASGYHGWGQYPTPQK